MEGFRIFKREALTETFRRVIREQIRMSMDYCRRSENEPDLATHEIRKCTKRIRAVYRLFREVTGYTGCRHGQEHLRTISGLLSEHRASKVHIDILTGIGSDKRLRLDGEHLVRLLEVFRESHHKLTAEIIGKDHVYQRVNSLLSVELERFESQYVSACSFDLLERSFKKTYLRGKKNLEIMQNQYSSENLHTFRKTVKCLWNQVSLIRPVWASNIGMTVHYLDMLAERLGYDHDLDDLYRFLHLERRPQDLVIPLQLIDYIAVKRKQHLNRIMHLAIRIFSEKPGSFAERLTSYYHVFSGRPAHR